MIASSTSCAERCPPNDSHSLVTWSRSDDPDHAPGGLDLDRQTGLAVERGVDTPTARS